MIVYDLILRHECKANLQSRQTRCLAAARRATVLRVVLDDSGDEQDLSQAAPRDGRDVSTISGVAGAVGARSADGVGDRRETISGLGHADAAAQAAGGAGVAAAGGRPKSRTPGGSQTAHA